MDHNGVTGTNGPKDSIMVGQQFMAKKTDWKNQSVQSHWRHCLARHDYRWQHCLRPHDYRWRHDHRGHSGSFQTFRVFSALSTCVLRLSCCTIYIAIITVCDARTGGFLDFRSNRCVSGLCIFCFVFYITADYAFSARL